MKADKTRKRKTRRRRKKSGLRKRLSANPDFAVALRFGGFVPFRCVARVLGSASEASRLVSRLSTRATINLLFITHKSPYISDAFW